jgi:hypothetical protein
MSVLQKPPSIDELVVLMDIYLFWREARRRRWIAILLALSSPLYGLVMISVFRAWTGPVDVAELAATFASWWAIGWHVDRWVDGL